VSLLDGIHDPHDLRRLKRESLKRVVEEVRQRHIDVVAEKGGHFGASLGVAELTVALHYVFDTPRDQLVWDTGHQAYIHKILTGRNDRLPSIRTRGGLAPVPPARRVRVRRVRRRPCSHLDLRGVGDGRRPRPDRTRLRGRGDHRRRRDGVRARLRGAQQRGTYRPRLHRRPQRQRHVDRACRRAP
jgi:hypothetical protein